MTAPQREAGQRPLACVSDMRTSLQLWGRDASGVWGPRDSLLERDTDLAVLKDGPGCEGQWCHSEEEQGRGGSEPAGWGRGVLAPMSTWGPCQ